MDSPYLLGVKDADRFYGTGGSSFSQLGIPGRKISFLGFRRVVMGQKAEEHPRVVLHGFLPPDLCKELEFIHRSCGAVGYRPNVFSTTLSHLIATNCAHLILPFIPIRERLLEKVEECFGCQGELFIEFTGLISWCKGANIGWHSDDNKPYLKQRDFAAVCYLNNYGKDFKGGVFHFKDGEPASIFPVAGNVALYTADNRNVHSVDQVTDGERLTLTLWFTCDSSHDEDAKLITLLSQRLSNQHDGGPHSFLPCPAPHDMYWFSHNQSSFDVRWARIQILGYNFFVPDDRDCNSSSSMPVDSLDQLSMPLLLGRGEKILDKEFANSLHALQVVQFYYWKASELKAARKASCVSDGAVEPALRQLKCGQELVFPCDLQLAETFLSLSSGDDEGQSFDWNEFSLAVAKWEDHSRALHEDLLGKFPIWRTYQTIFSVAPAEI